MDFSNVGLTFTPELNLFYVKWYEVRGAWVRKF